MHPQLQSDPLIAILCPTPTQSLPMDFGENLELLAQHRYLQWLAFLQTKQPELSAWVSSFRPQRLP